MSSNKSKLAAAALSTALAVAATSVSSAEPARAPGLKDRTIGYALTSAVWGFYQSKDGKEECPNGFNEGQIGRAHV